MILVNKQEVSLSALSKKLGIDIPLETIKKKPLFEINPAYVLKDPANGPTAVKHRNAMDFPAFFRAKNKNGENIEVRYCTNYKPDPDTHGKTDKYSPRAVEFDGKAEFIADDLDKAVYFFLHPYCKTSPYRENGKPFEYELVDDDQKANTIIKNLTLRTEAINHVATLNNDDILIIAKGMRISGVSGMEPLMVKAKLMEFAGDNPAEYLNRAQSQVNHINGLIVDAVDRKIFVLENLFNSKRWKWGKGPKSGEVIVEMASTVQDDNEALITHIANSPGAVNEILPVLIQTHASEKTSENVNQNLAGIDVLQQLKEARAASGTESAPVTQAAGQPGSFHSATSVEGTQSGAAPATQLDETETQNGAPVITNDTTRQELEDDFVDENPLPQSFDEAKEYLGKNIGKKTPALASALMKGIESGEITKDNIEMILEEYKTK